MGIYWEGFRGRNFGVMLWLLLRVCHLTWLLSVRTSFIPLFYRCGRLQRSEQPYLLMEDLNKFLSCNAVSDHRIVWIQKEGCVCKAFPFRVILMLMSVICHPIDSRNIELTYLSSIQL
uniref:Uncharacterized protein n=1 Tax=Rhizophora mucronata TaxID=61149 RepID=A0A2P2L0B3_RHIMU